MSDQAPEAAEQAATTQTEAPQAGEQQGQQVAGQQAESPDILGQINTRLDEWGGQLPSLVAQAVADQQYQYEDPYDQQQYQQAEQDPYNGLDPNDPIQSRLIQAEQRLQAFEQSTQGVQRDLWSRDLQGILDRHTELNPTHQDHNPQASQAVMNNLRQAGFDVNGMVPPQALEMAYKAYKADQIAAQQDQATQQAQQGVTLESATAQQSQPEPDPGDEIFGPSGQQPANPDLPWAVR